MIGLTLSAAGLEEPARIASAGPCQYPITFKIGVVSPEFGLTQSELKSAVIEAGNLWSTPIGRTLFAYSPQGEVAINLVYDARQQIAQSSDALWANVADDDASAHEIKEQIAPMQDDLAAKEAAYLDQLAQFNKNKLSNIAKNERSASAEESAHLAESKTRITQLNNDINVLIDKHNALVEQSNAQKAFLKSHASALGEFEKGRFVTNHGSNSIDIYQFKNSLDLALVLAHEIGHALGLAHSLDPQSVMAPVMQTKALSLSSDDLTALKRICQSK